MLERDQFLSLVAPILVLTTIQLRTPILLKDFEYLLTKPVNVFAEKNNFLPNLQLDFHRVLGTFDPLLILTNFV